MIGGGGCRFSSWNLSNGTSSVIVWNCLLDIVSTLYKDDMMWVSSIYKNSFYHLLLQTRPTFTLLFWHAPLPVNMAQQRDATLICLFDVDGTLTAPRQVCNFGLGYSAVDKIYIREGLLFKMLNQFSVNLKLWG